MDCGTTKNRIKVFMVAAKFDVTGISAVIMNYCAHMDLSKFEIVIAAGIPISDIHSDACKQLGIRLYVLPNRWKDSKGYYKRLNSIIKNEHPDVLHVHGNSATMAIELLLAWIHGVKVRIPHSHNTTSENLKRHKMMLPIFNRLYTQAFACGQRAGEWLYGNKKFYIIPNGFDIERFKFSSEARNEIRTEIGAGDALVIGHIGRINEQKNQTFLLKVFEQLASQRDDAILLMVGVGPDYEKVKELISRSRYKDRIIMYGETSTPERMYSAMDVFVLPSKYEGLPVVLVEAECSGLHCLISDCVTDEMNIGNHITSLPLDDDLQKWCDAINAVPKIDREAFYRQNKNAINKYDITADAGQLEKLYLEFVCNRQH